MISHRAIHGSILLLSISALAIAFFFMEKHLGLPPCPLCVIDRLLLLIIAALALLAFWQNPVRLGQRVYSGSHLVFALLGSAVATRHIQLQNMPLGQIPDCLPDLGYMLDAFSWLETAGMIFNAAGECAQVQWHWAGLTIPEQTLLLFIGLALLAIFNLVKCRQIR